MTAVVEPDEPADPSGPGAIGAGPAGAGPTVGRAGATRSRLRAAHDQFVATGATSARAVRSLVVESWGRSRSVGVDPESDAPPPILSRPDLESLRREHPLAVALPAIRHLLVQPAEGWVTALADADGHLLWVEGDASSRRRAERVGFVEGSMWREECAGTNAPGVALATGAEVTLYNIYSQNIKAG